MESRGTNAGRLGLALLAGLAGAVIFTALAKPRAGHDHRFIEDYPAYAGHHSSALKPGSSGMGSLFPRS